MKGSELQVDIELSVEERDILATIEFDAMKLAGFEEAKQNGERVAGLFRALQNRSAIPEIRLRVFSDQEHSPDGRPRSPLDDFRSKGNSDEDILRHPHFLAYLRYFISGPYLPSRLSESFKDRVRECGGLTSGDIEPLVRYARSLVRDYGLDPRLSRNEIFRLALEAGLEPDWARRVRRALR